jgi:hypothetical protein
MQQVIIMSRASQNVHDKNTPVNVPSASGIANSIMSFGKISGMPPTLVLTMKRPAEAASMMEIPNASVKEVVR